MFNKDSLILKMKYLKWIKMNIILYDLNSYLLIFNLPSLKVFMFELLKWKLIISKFNIIIIIYKLNWEGKF